MVPLLKKYISFVPIHKLLFKKPIISSLWLFLPTIAVSLYVSLNKTLVGAFDSIKDAGFYSQSDALIKLLLTLSLAVGSAMMPHVSYLFHKGNLEKVYENIYRSFHLMTFFGVAMCFGVIAIADVFVPLFYGPGFEKVASLLMIESLIIILISWSNVIGVQYLIPSDQIKYYTASVTLGSCLNIIINLFAIPLLKVDGAMIATVLAEGSVTCYQLFIVRKQLTIAKLFQGAWKPLISGLCMLASVVILNQLIYSVLHPVYVIIADILIGSSLYFGLNSLFKEASVLFLLKKIQSFL